MLIEAFVAAGLVMMMSLIGVFFIGRRTAQVMESRLPLLISFAAGVFLVTSGSIALEVFEIADSYMQAAIVIAVGYALALGLQYVLPETHHHHDAHCARKKGGAQRLIIGDAIHNVADGVVLVSAFAVAPLLGVAATVSIMIHEALQELSEFFVLRQAGYSVRRALAINFITASTILVGVVLGYYALLSHDIEVVLLGLAAGFFAQVVIHDLLPRGHVVDNRSSFLMQVGCVLIGILLMMTVSLFLHDSHAHGEASGVETH